MSNATSNRATNAPSRVHRVEVRVRPGRSDPRADSISKRAKNAGFTAGSVAAAQVYLVEGDFSAGDVESIASAILTDPVTQVAHVGSAPAGANAAVIEVHPLPGVMDPAAQSVQEAITALLGRPASVSTGLRLDVAGVSSADGQALARGLIANPVVHQIVVGPYHPASLPHGSRYALKLRHIPIRDLNDEQLATMSRQAHLFLSLDEMRAVRDEYRTLGREPTDIELETIAQTWSEHCVHKTLKSTVRYSEKRSSNEGERGSSGDGLRGSLAALGAASETSPLVVQNLLKSTIARATHELMADGVTFPLSVFKDNSGVVALDETWAVNIKVETHNRPSAIEPYGGAATGAGGCIRDVIATGLGAKPIANTDVFCVAQPGNWNDNSQLTTQKSQQTAGGRGSHVSSDLRDVSCALPPGTLHPRRILSEVVSGVRDYGNRMGIPTVNGAVHFDDRYVGNPLVFCGCIGILPRSMVRGGAKAGDRIIALGGRTGRDGIHGATFSSAELGQTASTEFAHAVQIGNAIEEKRLLDAIVRARDVDGGPLYSGLTDCGAGGFSSAIGEMGSSLGAFVTLEKAPLKYSGLSYTEIWISEAQERIVLAVPAQNVAALQGICDEEGVELADLGHFGTPNAELILNYEGTEVGRLPMHFLHDGIPMPTREAVWLTSQTAGQGNRLSAAPSVSASLPRTGGLPARSSISASLAALLSHPSIASKHWLIRMYDHEVQGHTAIKPLHGPREVGPGDASVITPVPGSRVGAAIACGLQVGVGDPRHGGDPYQMALAGIDECVRNLVCVGADPSRIAILDNFCWPSCDKPENMGALVRACFGCYDGAMAYRTPFVSGKDSLNNQLRYTDPSTGEKRVIEIPFTLLVTGLGIVADASRCVTMDAKRAGNVIVLVGETQGRLGGSILQQLDSSLSTSAGRDVALRDREGSAIPRWPIPLVNLNTGPAAARAVASLIASGVVHAAHDVSDGGLLCALSEMLIATCPRPGDVARDIAPLGATVAVGDGDAVLRGLDLGTFAFCESPSRYLLEVAAADAERAIAELAKSGIPAVKLATLNDSARVSWKAAALDEPVTTLRDIWMKPLDW